VHGPAGGHPRQGFWSLRAGAPRVIDPSQKFADIYDRMGALVNAALGDAGPAWLAEMPWPPLADAAGPGAAQRPGQPWRRWPWSWRRPAAPAGRAGGLALLAVASIAVSWLSAHAIFTRRPARCCTTARSWGRRLQPAEPPSSQGFAGLVLTIG
jgi:hypothetical protein